MIFTKSFDSLKPAEPFKDCTIAEKDKPQTDGANYRSAVLLLIIGLLSLFFLEPRASANPKDNILLSFEEKWLIAESIYQIKALNPGTQYPETEVSSFISNHPVFSQVLNSDLQPAIISVNTFNEFLKKFKGEWPDTGTLEEDLSVIKKHFQWVPKKYISANPQVQKQIDLYLSKRRDWLTKKIASVLIEKINVPIERLFKNSSATNSPLSFDFLRWLAEAMNTEFEKTIHSITQQFRGHADGTSPISLLIQEAIKLYLENLPAERKVYIFFQFLNENLNMPDEQKIEVVLQNAGPPLQKLLQNLSHDPSIPENLRRIFEKFENQVKAVPSYVAADFIEPERKKYNILKWNPKPLGVGSMAQTHQANILLPGNIKIGAAPRFIKPGVVARIDEDEKILTVVARILDQDTHFQNLGLPKLSPLVEDIIRSIRIELDLPGTRIRQKMARLAYNKEFFIEADGLKFQIIFAVPEIIEPLDGSPSSESHLLMQRLIVGQKIDTALRPYTEASPVLQKAIFEKLAEMWIETVFFKKAETFSGFFHADLHPGNLLVSIGEPSSQVFILDYGMGGQISKAFQDSFSTLAIGIETRRSELIAEALWSISDFKNNRISLDQVKNKIIEQLQSQPKALSIEDWVTWSMNQGLKYKFEVINLHRGLLTISQLLKKSGSEKKTLDFIFSLAKKYPYLTLQILSRHHISPTEMFRLGLKAYSKLDSQKQIKMTNSCEILLN